MDGTAADATRAESRGEKVMRRFRELMATGDGSVLPSEAAAEAGQEFGVDASTVLFVVAMPRLSEHLEGRVLEHLSMADSRSLIIAANDKDEAPDPDEFPGQMRFSSLDRLFADPRFAAEMLHRKLVAGCSRPVEVLMQALVAPLSHDDLRRDRPRWQSSYGPARRGRRGR